MGVAVDRSKSNILKDFIIGSEAARLLGKSPQIMISLARRGKVRYVRLGGNGTRVYYRPDVLQLAASRGKLRRMKKED